MASAPAFTAVTVLDAWDETPSLRGLRLDLGALAGLHVAPGQILKVKDPVGDGGAYFALATGPGRTPAEILLKRGASHVDALIEQARPGSSLSIVGPIGHGFLVEPMAGRDVLLFAAGSGISPVRSLIQHIAPTRRDLGKVVLYYGQRHEKEFAYESELASWADAGMVVRLCCSRPAATWNGERGHVQDVARKLAFDGITPRSAVAYLCGMKRMVDDVKRILVGEGMPASRCFLNY